jgi:prophage DNA circulation protein
MLGALDQARAATTIGTAAPDEAQAVYAGLTDLKRAVAADIDERIGRLPSVLTVETPARVSAWLIAQHVQGDDPQKLAACYDDLVVRNKLRHPAGAGPGEVEVLPR